jgi:hypothetical protein
VADLQGAPLTWVTLCCTPIEWHPTVGVSTCLKQQLKVGGLNTTNLDEIIFEWEVLAYILQIVRQYFISQI